MKKRKMHNSELPDCVKSYIFSKLSLKDLLKTMLPKSLPLFQDFQSQFATRLDQFILHHQGDMIHSIRVEFPLSDQHSHIIDRMISKGISKGVKHIELLFSHDDVASDLTSETKPYKFSFNLLSDTDSLIYLHLEKCLIEESTNLSGLKNLRTLVLHEVVVNQDMIQGLCCMKLLFHLNIVHYQRKRNIDIIASNLASIDYSYNHKYEPHTLKIEAHMLSKFSYKGAKRDKNPYPFGPIARLHHIENVAMIINASQITELSAILVRFQNLRQLELFIERAYDLNMDYFWILYIAMASPHLQKFAVRIRHSDMKNSHMVGFKRQRREYAKFSHDDLKYVELWAVRENGPRALMVVGSNKIIHEMLKDDVNEQCRLIIL
ncbi:hypothetical protein QL285_088849 [Trifolium repens]|nr:hypothetical protein QL285_088849 [Trifolium repens]